MSEPRRMVLIVDDEPFITQSFSDFFEDRLWRALRAGSGEQALELLRTESPQAVVVDIRLGGMDGETFIRKAVRSNPGMAFAICTGSPEFDLSSDLRDQSCVSDRVFRKPMVNMDELESELLRIMEVVQEESRQ